MKRHSLPNGSEPLEIRNTGLRPSWNSFWALETSGTDSEGSAIYSQRVQASSLLSSKSAYSGGTSGPGGSIRHIRLVTGSEWIGEWDSTGMTGMGMYKMPHGVIYEGTMKAGLFEGVGILKYPNGSYLEGLWYQGRLKYWQYEYADGLERDCQDWSYCSMPDRRFYWEHIVGLRPANTEQSSNDHPAREVPPGHYDVGLGFYNPKSHCVVDAVTGEVLSIPTADEEKWILQRCRSSEPIETVGFRPDLYENLFEEYPAQSETQEIGTENYEKDLSVEGISLLHSDSSQIKSLDVLKEIMSDKAQAESEKELSTAENEILTLLQQKGAKLDPINASSTSYRKCSLQDKLQSQGVSELDEEPFRTESFDGLFKKILKEIDYKKHSIKLSDVSGRKADTIGNESNLFKLTQIISTFAEATNRKKTVSLSMGSGGGGGALEQLPHSPHSFPANDGVSGLVSEKVEKAENVLSFKKTQSVENMINSTNYETSENDL